MTRRRKSRGPEPGPCWYCGVETRDYGIPGTVPRDQATTEHLLSRRRQPERPNGPRAPVVVACWECNNARGGWTGRLITAEDRMNAPISQGG